MSNKNTHLADFVSGFQKLFFHLKALQTRMQIDEEKIFCSSSGSEDICEKHKFQNQLDVYFCYSLYNTEVTRSSTFNRSLKCFDTESLKNWLFIFFQA